ncbi:ABC transporter substrate-binding protein [Kaustia mangrovi]|uniref:ABC transporter substrate-binding protein n=1 Tax=Kaustia mangrovi TaxID=2593653 RepID=A0A7S8HCW0_9HYPH|nr:ABC transporter substrate-binding protein [Kaustia mangrovi]QPC44142.1 ABC transporter substrate-binding protein [Kaustia mangrovi]
MSGPVQHKITRRTLLQGAAAGGVASAAGLWPGLAWSQSACKVLRAGITGYSVINTLDPMKASLIPEFYVLWAIFNGLLKFNDKMEIEGDLAESWEAVSPTVWRFRLREGVTFHDGKPMTSEDVKFTFERLMAPDADSPHKSKFEAVTEVRAVDPLTVEIETAKPFAPLLSYLTNARTGSQIVPKHVLDGGDEAAFAQKPIGTGAYAFEAYKPNVEVKLKAHEGYFVEGQPAIPAVDMPLIPEESSGVTALLGGTIDLTSTAPFADVPELVDDPEVTVAKSAGLNTRFIALNHKAAPFDDVHFRRAVSMAFDRATMVQIVLFGEGEPANGIIPAALSWAHTSKPREICSFNPDKAKAELEKSKYGAGTEAVVLTWGSGWWKRFAEVFVAQVNETLGVNFRVEVSEANTVYSRLKASDYQASIWGWLGLIDPDEYMYDIMHTEGWRNFQGYSNSELDALIVKAREEIDQAKRGALYREAESLMLEDAPVLCCFESNVHNLMKPAVKGFVQLPYSAYGGQLAAVTGC